MTSRHDRFLLGVERLASARSFLFVPGNRPDRFGKAVASGADVVILDLEDAVDPDAKAAARRGVRAHLHHGPPVVVRINGLDSPWSRDDVDAIGGLPGLLGVMVPKAEDPEQVRRVAAATARPVVPLVETAVGIERLADLVTAPGIPRLAFGSVDLALDLGAQESWEALIYARSRLVVVSRSVGLAAPVDGVTVELRDDGVLTAATRRARALGFGAKLCIHPRQVPVVHAAFAPDGDELEWAREVLRADVAGGAVAVRGQMVDRPVLERARRIVMSLGRDARETPADME
ncbi:CoA ester lyase [Geodermatophilus sabuli]|uniref:CoA ester lyase n=1 Tax=Geodermatophilus sabuli TaxID=1564158 RepID=A0A7K3VW49_9ACTN|nr:CoA ester lyase [Geodermatophilus sabuli]NEK56869.1 CoA ester lyase [Geodermatophilus sabuli]